MIEKGKYKEDVESLDDIDLSIFSYEKIFKIYTTAKENKEFYFYNILRKISLPDELDADAISYYDVKTSMPLTTISYEIYDDMRLWWLIFFLNEETVTNNGLFVVSGGTQLKFLRSEYLPTILSQINKITRYNGRHY